MDRLFGMVKKIYAKTHSINKTASACSISRVKVRKILISLGLYKNELSSQITKFLNEGYSKDFICKKMSISNSCFNEHIPYKKGLYQGEERSKQALRSERFRIKENRSKILMDNLKKEKERL